MHVPLVLTLMGLLFAFAFPHWPYYRRHCAKHAIARRTVPRARIEGCALGYRVWTVDEAKNLCSYAEPREPWPKRRRCEAACSNGETHPSPDPHCSCGLYALDRRAAREQSDQRLLVLGEPTEILGLVATWGRTMRGSHGWRAQYAYPQVLYYNGFNKRLVQAAARAYGIDAAPLPHDFAPERAPALGAAKGTS